MLAAGIILRESRKAGLIVSTKTVVLATNSSHGNTIVKALRKRGLRTTLERTAKDLGVGRTLGKGRRNSVLLKRIKTTSGRFSK